MISAKIHRTAQFQALPSSDGKVDRPDSSCPEALHDIRDSRIEAFLSQRDSKDFSAMGESWEGSYSSLPVWGRRGMEALDRWTTFKSEAQQLEVNWESRTVTLDTQGQDPKTGHRVQAGFDYQSRLKPETVQEFTYNLVD